MLRDNEDFGIGDREDLESPFEAVMVMIVGFLIGGGICVGLIMNVPVGWL